MNKIKHTTFKQTKLEQDSGTNDAANTFAIQTSSICGIVSYFPFILHSFYIKYGVITKSLIQMVNV